MKLKRLGSIFLAAAMMTAALTGCGGGDSKAEGGDSKAEGGKSTVTLWATGSDNVRSIFEKLTEDFNTNSEYKDLGLVELYEGLLADAVENNPPDLILSLLLLVHR